MKSHRMQQLTVRSTTSAVTVAKTTLSAGFVTPHRMWGRTAGATRGEICEGGLFTKRTGAGMGTTRCASNGGLLDPVRLLPLIRVWTHSNARKMGTASARFKDAMVRPTVRVAQSTCPHPVFASLTMVYRHGGALPYHRTS